ncbi:MAG: hypothetical protein JW995_13035 [Melioribacteraceae bacterium]|nr:hypothetical protein [Melioribacteraceae bacterium]
MTPDRKKTLSVILVITAAHSLAVGIGLIIMPAALINFFGFAEVTERFFPSQGGVFHIVMAAGYAMAAYNSNKCDCLIQFSVFVKFCATFFLLIYFLFFLPVWLVLVSCVTDFILGSAILIAYRSNKNLLVRGNIIE